MDAGLDELDEVVTQEAVDFDDVFLLVVELGAEDLVHDVAIVREEDEAFGLFVEATDREDALGMPDEFNDVAFDVAFGRAGDADRLVERDVDRGVLLAGAADELALDSDLVAWFDLGAEGRDLPVDSHFSSRDQVIGLPA